MQNTRNIASGILWKLQQYLKEMSLPCSLVEKLKFRKVASRYVITVESAYWQSHRPKIKQPFVLFFSFIIDGLGAKELTTCDMSETKFFIQSAEMEMLAQVASAFCVRTVIKQPYQRKQCIRKNFLQQKLKFG